MNQLTGHPVFAKGLLQYCAPMSSHSATRRSSAVVIQPACVPPASNLAKNAIRRARAGRAHRRSDGHRREDRIAHRVDADLDLLILQRAIHEHLRVVSEQELAIGVELRRLVRRRPVAQVELRRPAPPSWPSRSSAHGSRLDCTCGPRDHRLRHRIERLPQRAPERVNDRLVADHDSARSRPVRRCNSNR